MQGDPGTKGFQAEGAAAYWGDDLINTLSPPTGYSGGPNPVNPGESDLIAHVGGTGPPATQQSNQCFQIIISTAASQREVK